MYKAPEILEDEEYSGQKVDLFAAVICLFALRAATFPFGKASTVDSLYKFIAGNRPDKFWNFHAKNRTQGFFSEDFKDFCTTMFQHDASHRLNMADVLGHPWMKGYTAT